MGTLRVRRLAISLAATVLLGCSYVNVQLNDNSLPLERRVANRTRSAVFADVSSPTTRDSVSMLRTEHTVRPGRDIGPGPQDADGFFVGLALSGGGSRSANFAAASMFQLQRAGLLQHVDYISSVSGGSLAAAFYCAHDKEWNPADVQQALSRSFATDLILRSLDPLNMMAYSFTDWDRSDVLAGIFQEELFSRDGRALTFADLRSDRPRLLINATDLQSGRRFVFCNESFDEINSDLCKYPLAYAVAASSAVPVVLHPVTLRDYATTFRQYRHLIDAGVAENLGVQTLVETYNAQITAARAAGRPDPYPHGAVYIVINAQTRFNARLAQLSDVGAMASLKTAMGLTSRSMVNRVNSATLAEILLNNAPDVETARELRAHIRQLDRDGFLQVVDAGGHQVRVIYLSLAQLEGLPNLPFESFVDAVNSIDTYFNITPAEAASLYQAAELVMKDKLEASVRAVVREIETAAPIPPTPAP
ncbi:MAG TPA: patatin-like phospholipase family protein [Tepidisphaeraceae bacterium]|jgi:predicted acylesterase/phospholipase RssA|nr:patatin-like phospholipase family protein [Tepidisphaeraceae bacterium]